MKTPLLRSTLFGMLVACAPIAVGQEGEAADPPDLGRFSLIYSPEIPLGSGSLGQAIGRAAAGGGIQNLGFELSTPLGLLARYHAQLDYMYGYGVSGVRLEPLAVGWAIPLIRTRFVGLEIEPLLSLVDAIMLFTDDTAGNSNVTFLLGSGAEVQLNLTLGPVYLFASPLGLEVRYLEVTSGAAHQTMTGADPYYRFRAGVGVQY